MVRRWALLASPREKSLTSRPARKSRAPEPFAPPNLFWRRWLYDFGGIWLAILLEAVGSKATSPEKAFHPKTTKDLRT